MGDNLMPNSDDDNPNRRGPLIALGVVVLLFVVGWKLATMFHANGKLEDCLLSGWTNCVPVEPPPR